MAWYYSLFFSVRAEVMQQFISFASAFLFTPKDPFFFTFLLKTAQIPFIWIESNFYLMFADKC